MVVRNGVVQSLTGARAGQRDETARSGSPGRRHVPSGLVDLVLNATPGALAG